MPQNKKEPEFTVTDRRKFTSEGERREDTPPEAAPTGVAAEVDQAAPAEPSEPSEPSAPAPPPPSAAQQQAQQDAYQDATRKLDMRIQEQIGDRRIEELQMTFERFVASLYMTALMQLGLVREEGAQPRADLFAARQTIDIIGILSEKTRGNLSDAEKNFLENSLYELRMAYLEITQALATAQPGARPDGTLG